MKIPIVITGRESRIVENRCRELKITELIQKSTDKVSNMKKVLNKLEIELDEAAYIGDDLNDLECMKLVAVRGCPADAVNAVKECADYVSQYNGGHGAVREIIDMILDRRDLYD